MKYAKLLHNGSPRWGVIENDTVRLIDGLPYDGAEYTGETVPFASAKLLAPCDATKIVCIGKNYYDHAIEFGGPAPEEPIIFIKPTTCITDQDGEVEKPAICERFDYEGEIAIVFKRRARNVKKEDALDYILGYTCLNDITARDIQQKDGQWTRGKGFDGCAPIGPVVADGLRHDAISIETRLNGELRQKATSDMLMWDIPSLIEYVTACMTMLPGDVLTTGTPVNVAPMVPGDVVEVTVGGVGTLRTRII